MIIWGRRITLRRSLSRARYAHDDRVEQRDVTMWFYALVNPLSVATRGTICLAIGNQP